MQSCFSKVIVRVLWFVTYTHSIKEDGLVINSRLVVARCPVLIPAGTTAILLFSLVTLFLLHELQVVPRRRYDRFLTNPFQFVVSSHRATDATSPDILLASYNRLQNHSHLVVSLKNAVRNCEKQYFELGTPKTRHSVRSRHAVSNLNIRIFRTLLDTQLAEMCHTKGQWHTAIYNSPSVTRTVCEEG